jgi:FtsZ-binding cell division protein ZapB
VGEREKELNLTLTESNEIKHINGDFFKQNSKLKEDLAFCQEHLQNLLKHNAFIQ